MNKKTKIITPEQFEEIIRTMREGFARCRPNKRAAFALELEARLGLRISEVLRLRLADVVQYGEGYCLEITEQKTGKPRVFTVLLDIKQKMEKYCLRNGIGLDEQMFPITERAVQKQLKLVCDYLGIEGVSTHSFRKCYATELYKVSGCDIEVVQTHLQHRFASTTKRYIGLRP